MTEPTREHLLESLTGVRSSRRTFYSEYREQERRLDWAIAAIADISAALCNTTSGVAALIAAVLQAAAQHFDADWAVLALGDPAAQPWVAQRVGDEVTISSRAAPAPLAAIVGQVLAQRQIVAASFGDARQTLGAPMFLSDQLAGALGVVPRRDFAFDGREISVLQTLANQAAVAIENARLYEATVQQKTLLEEKNRQLEKARHWLALARQNEVVGVERNRIARELHDSVAQHLISIGMNLEWCRAQLPEAAPIYERVCSTKELARSAVSRIRATIYELSALNGSQSSLSAALHELAIDVEKLANMPVRLRIPHDPRPLPAEQRHALYSIAQEALFNAYKHAQASAASVELRFNRTTVRLVVADDGVGIAEDVRQGRPAAAGAARHFGLGNMRERAEELGGTFRITRGRRGGTVVSATLPLVSPSGSRLP